MNKRPYFAAMADTQLIAITRHYCSLSREMAAEGRSNYHRLYYAAYGECLRRRIVNQVAPVAVPATAVGYNRNKGENEMDTKRNAVNKSWFERAKNRVSASPSLMKHYDTIMYDWPEGDTHWQWVATAKIAEITGWAETVEDAND